MRFRTRVVMYRAWPVVSTPGSPASRASLAALFAITFLSEPPTWRIAVGGSLMLAAMVIVETGPAAQAAPVPLPTC